MAYSGISIPIPMGQGGLHTDDSPNTIPPTDLLVANNVRLHQGMVEKDAGSARFNTTAIPLGVLAAIEFSPDYSARYVICVGGDGNVYAVNSAGVVSAAIVSTTLAAPLTVTFGNQIQFVIGGGEVAGNSRKLFLFNGVNPVQAIEYSAGWLMDNISAPAANWSGTDQPKFGFIHKNRLFAGGNINDPNRLYASLSDNHEDFAAVGTYSLSVSPGDGEEIVMAKVYKGKILVFKKPYGVFAVDDSNFDETKWTITKIHAGLGAASYHCGVQVLDDFIFKNNTGSITSLAATASFGDVEAGDVLSILRIEQTIRDAMELSSGGTTHALFYSEKKLAYFSYRSTTSSVDDRLLCFYVGLGERPRATIITKELPKCLFLKRDSSGIERPCYGSAEANPTTGVIEGFIYLMDQVDRNVNNTPYLGEFQTPHIDFGFAGQQIAHKNKNFDFIELRYSSDGDYSVYGDVFIDGVYTETLDFKMDSTAELASDTPESDDFMLDENDDGDSSSLADDNLKTARNRVRGMGRTISVRFYNGGLNQSFKIATVIFSFRASGEQNTKG